jgi:hypothetical protein
MFKRILLTFLSSVLGLMLIAGVGFAVGMVEKSSSLSAIGSVHAASTFGTTTEGMLLLIGVPILAFLYLVSSVFASRKRVQSMQRGHRYAKLPERRMPQARPHAQVLVPEARAARRLTVEHASQQVVVLAKREKPRRIPVISQIDGPADAVAPVFVPQGRIGMDGIVRRKRRVMAAIRQSRPIDGVLRWSPSWPTNTRPQIAAY